MFALFARVQFKPAFRTLPEGLAQIFKQGAALRAPRNRPRSWHVERPRPEGVVPLWRSRFLLLLLCLVTGVLVATLPVFAVGQGHLLEGLIVRLYRPLHKVFFLAPDNPRIPSTI